MEPTGSTAGEVGRGGGIRTHDLIVPNDTRYQAAPRPDRMPVVSGPAHDSRGRPRRSRADQARNRRRSPVDEDADRPPRAGSRMGTTASAARTNETAISQNTTGSPTGSPSQAMIVP